jgi:hypothetical protein
VCVCGDGRGVGEIGQSKFSLGRFNSIVPAAFDLAASTKMINAAPRINMHQGQSPTKSPR